MAALVTSGWGGYIRFLWSIAYLDDLILGQTRDQCLPPKLAYQRSVTHAKWSIHVKNCQNRLELSSFQNYLKVIVDLEMSMVQGEEKGQMTSNDDYTTTPLNPIKILTFNRMNADDVEK